MITTPKHTISVVVAGREVREWESYTIDTDLVGGVDSFTMRVPFSREAWDLLGMDRPIQILVDGIAVLTGFIDDSDQPEDADVIEIAGRNRVGRLIDESAPGINFSGLGIKELIQKIASPWFGKVTFDNSRNRKVVRGKGKKARAGSEPVKLNTRVGTTIEPGQTRWAAITQLCEQAGYLCWSSGDGKELIVGKPNYDQEVQFRFFRPANGSARAAESTVMGMGVRRTTGDRYSRVICVGSGQGTDVNYGAKVASRYGQARNSDKTKNGEGIDFSAQKVLIVQRAVKSAAEAREFAESEMARRDSQARVLTVRAAGHGQTIAGTRTTLFAIDTLAAVEDERTGIRGTYAIVSHSLSSARSGAESSTMRLVPRGAVLSR